MNTPTAINERRTRLARVRASGRLGRSPRRRATTPTLPAGSKHQRAVIGLASVLLAIAFWQLAAALGWLNPLFTSSPLSIARRAGALISDGSLGASCLASAKLFAVGFAVSIVTAVPFGIFLGWYRRLSAVFDPFVTLLYATPRIALIPLVLVWFGIGFQAQVVIVWIGAFFPLLLNTIAGVRSVDTDLLGVARTYLATDYKIFKTLALPSALPYVMTGIRQSLNYALLGVVVAEFFAGNTGIGAMIVNAGLTLDTASAFLGLAVIAGAALAMSEGIRALERRLSRWRGE